MVVAEQNQFFAQNVYTERRPSRRQFFGKCNRLPVAPQKFAARSSRIGPGQETIFFFGDHMMNSPVLFPRPIRWERARVRANLPCQIHPPGNGMMPLNFAIVLSLSSRLERLTFGYL